MLKYQCKHQFLRKIFSLIGILNYCSYEPVFIKLQNQEDNVEVVSTRKKIFWNILRNPITLIAGKRIWCSSCDTVLKRSSEKFLRITNCKRPVFKFQRFDFETSPCVKLSSYKSRAVDISSALVVPYQRKNPKARRQSSPLKTLTRSSEFCCFNFEIILIIKK